MTDWHPAMPLSYRNEIVTGDARELAQAIPDESVDLIFTDPVYDRIDDYRWLAETATRVLKPDSACLAYCGIGYLPETHQAMLAGGLQYRWRFITRPVWSKEFHGRLIVMTQECLWYDKGRTRLRRSVFDYCYSTAKGYHDVDGANWGKGIEPLFYYIGALSDPGAVVLDTCVGSGTIPAVCKQMGRQWLGFEIDPDTAERARVRVEQTQPPLFVLTEEQATMEVLA